MGEGRDPAASAEKRDPAASAEKRDRADRAEHSDPADRSEKAERKLPMEPIEHAEPMEPMDSTEPLEPIERNEPSDHSDHRDLPTPTFLSSGPDRAAPPSKLSPRSSSVKGHGSRSLLVLVREPPAVFATRHSRVGGVHGSRPRERSPLSWQTGYVPDTAFHLIADVSSDTPGAIGSLLEELIDGTVTATPDGFHVDGFMRGSDARELNRFLLSALRRVERRTRLRAEWTANGETNRFFDYVPKGTRPAPRTQPEA
ncbi:MAG: hypothetical protein ACLP36_15485 [Acidimicrobiales bacterium]